MKPMIILALTIACALPTPAAAESSSCGMAVLQDVDVSTTLVPQASITTARNRRAKPGAVQDWWAYSTPGARLSKRYLVTVRLNDMVYTAEASGDGFWTYDPSTLVINDAIHGMIRERSDSRQIKQAAVASGMKTLMDDALSRALFGHTTLEEVLRVAYE